MSNECIVCGVNTIFFVWSTSRYFNRRKLISLLPKLGMQMKNDLLKGEYVVCQHCVDKLELTSK